MDINLAEWKKLATRMRRDILKMCSEVNSGHPGGSLSCVEIFITLFEHEMNLGKGSDRKSVV